MAHATLLPNSTTTAPIQRHDRESSEPPATRSSLGARLGLVGLLVATAGLYLWGLSASGYANSFYSAAVQAGSESWKAFFFGSLDAGNAITVDKPPASLWLMALSVRIFGLSSWSILVPQALLGVATVGMLYASVRRTSGHNAGLVAGALLALTPAAALMFRFNNPDALLVFLLTAATYLTLRATEQASARGLVGAGVLIGLAFLTKMLQAFLVLPAFALVYLIAAPAPLRRRVLHLVAAFGAMVVALGWWVAIVELVPASWRPYVGGSENNSILDLVFGYNGLGRIFGQGDGGTGPGGGGGGGFSASRGITRLFDGVSGGMIAWLIPAALLLGAIALVSLRGTPRTDPVRAAVVMWASWLLVTGLVFSLMAGTYHDYYTVALAPAVAALVAVAGNQLWLVRDRWLARIGLAVAVLVTAGWAYVLLSRATGAYATLRWPVVAVGLVAALGLLVAHRLPRVLASLVLALAIAGSAAGPTAYALNTVATPHQGSIVTAGPVSGGGPGGGGGPDGGDRGGTRGTRAGGFGREAATSPELVTRLAADGDSFTWVAATTGSQSAATYQLAAERPVMAIGGFGGGDPSPTLAQFQAEVADGQIHYYISGGRGGGPGGGDGDGSATQIAAWVSETFTAQTVGSATIYDLTDPA